MEQTILFEQQIELVDKQFLTQEEIEQLEEEKKKKKLKQMEVVEIYAAPIVKGINELYKQGGKEAIKQFIEQGKDDPSIAKLKEIFDKQGAVIMLKFLNNQYLRNIESCNTILGKNPKVKETRKHKEYLTKLRIKSKKEIQNSKDIQGMINIFKKQQ